MITPDSIIAAARSAIGTPFVHQGRIAGRGLDCAGLIIHVAQSLGIEYIDRPGYSRRPTGGLLESALDGQPALVRCLERQPGDILLMRFQGDPQHLAVFAGDTIIHAHSLAGKVCEHRLDSVWAARIVRSYQFKVAA